MRTMALLSCLVAACAAEADPSLYGGHFLGASLHGGYAAEDVRFAYGRPVTAINAQYAPQLVAAPAAYAGALPLHHGYAAAAPAAYAAPAVAAAAPVVSGPVSSQYQAQDELGNIAYGYSNINSAKSEQGLAGGAVAGTYSYNDEAGHHTISYVADDYGFRLVAPTAAALPAPVVDTPEVAGAKAAFFAAYDAAAVHGHRRRRSAEVLTAAPLAAAPLAVGAAAPAREALLTTIKLNPGHAIFYRVD